MNSTRRRLVASMVTVVCIAFGSSCGGDEEAIPGAVDVFGSLRGTDADLFVESLRSAPTLRNIDISYIGSQNFVDDLTTRVENDGDPPDIALIPQPGLIREFLEDGSIVPLDDATLASLDENLNPAAIALGEIEGTMVAVPYRLTAKSLVWYRPDVFAEHGWSVPQDLDGLVDLVDRIAESGELAPWCFSIESGSATGWAATDWIEDWMLRRPGPEAYDRWVAGETDFSAPSVQTALESFRSLVLEPGRVADDTRSIVLTSVEEQAAIFGADDAPCAMYKQADLALDWFPPELDVGSDGAVDFFVFPADTDPAPMLVGGFLAVAFVDRPDVNEVMRALASPAGSSVWRRAGTFLGPIESDDADTSVTGRLNTLLRDGREVRFDGSDSMPPAIGSGLFWDLISDWIAGSVTSEELAATLDEAFEEADTAIR